MKEKQAVTLWKRLRSNTNKGEVLSEFNNKKGWPKWRTLQRYLQADEYFAQGLLNDQVSKKTGWKEPFIDKIRPWWEDAFITSNTHPLVDAGKKAQTSMALEENEESVYSPTMTGDEKRDLALHRQAIKQRAVSFSMQLNKRMFDQLFSSFSHTKDLGVPGTEQQLGNISYYIEENKQIKIVPTIDGYGRDVRIFEELLEHIGSAQYKGIKERIESRNIMGGQIIIQAYDLVSDTRRSVDESMQTLNEVDLTNCIVDAPAFTATMIDCAVNLAMGVLKPKRRGSIGELNLLYSLSDIKYADTYPNAKDPYYYLTVGKYYNQVAGSDSHEKLAIFQQLHKSLTERFSELSETRDL